jgi:DNA-binding transcriptional MerR regulator
MPQPPTALRPRRLTIHQLADELGVPLATVRHWRRVGKGPRGYVIGRRLYFDADEVDRWLDALRASAS